MKISKIQLPPIKTINIRAVLAALALLLMMLPVVYDYLATVPTQRQLKSSDIFFIWHDAEQMAQGVNPYSRIHGSDMRQNNKFTTYLPGFFLFEVALIRIGISDFDQFFSIWRILNMAIYFGVAVLVYVMVKKRSESMALALFAAYFWILGRWSLSTLRIWQIDFLAILFLLLACFFLSERKHLAYIFLGCSLAIKQISIFALPIFILWELKGIAFTKTNLRQFAISCGFISAVPVLVSLPFIYMDFLGFFLSIIFSLTRNPGGLKLESIDQVLHLAGLPAKIPLFISLLFVYWLHWKNKLTLSQGILLSFLCFITFNSVLFKQYLPWGSAFVGLALADFISAQRRPDSDIPPSRYFSRLAGVNSQTIRRKGQKDQ